MPEPSKRAETGVMAFGDDWPGVFIRGDDAFGFALSLRELLNSSSLGDDQVSHIFAKAALQGLLMHLEGSKAVGGVNPEGTQQMKPFDEAKSP